MQQEEGPRGPLTWHVAAIYDYEEARARSRLEGQGFEVRIFFMVEQRVERGSAVERKEPLFPGYVFVADPTGIIRAHKVKNTPGVVRLLTSVGSTRPAEIASEFVDELERLDGAGEFVVDKRPRKYGRGEKVEVAENSPFRSALIKQGAPLCGICEQNQGDRVKLLFSWLDRRVSLILPVMQTRPA